MTPTNKSAYPLSVQITRGPEIVDVLDGRWDELISRCPFPNPTLTSTWFKELLLLAGGEPLAITVESGSTLVAGGVFELRRPRLGGLRMAKLLAHGMSIEETDLPCVNDAPGAARLVVDALFEEAHTLEFVCPSEGEFARALLERSPWTRVVPRPDGWMTPLPPPRLESHRKELARRLRQAEKKGADVRISVVDEPDDVLGALERLFVLHHERWHGRPGAISYFSDTERQMQFYRRAVGAMAQDGNVRVAEVFENGVLVSSYLGLLAGRGALPHTCATRRGGVLPKTGHFGLLALVDESVRAGATDMYQGRGNTNPGSPKTSAGGTPVPYSFMFAGRSRTIQQAISLGLQARSRVLRRVEPRKFVRHVKPRG
jgi:hypothetical protein